MRFRAYRTCFYCNCSGGGAHDMDKVLLFTNIDKVSRAYWVATLIHIYISHFSVYPKSMNVTK